MDLSYAQNLEDYHLSLAFAQIERGTYLDIGAGHPIADNVSLWFYERGWHGVVVEPQQPLIELYGKLRPRDIAVQCLVGQHNAETDFYVVDRLHGLSTTIEPLAQRARQFGVDFQKIRMPSVTLARLCDEHSLTDIDFLKLDVEGGEADVLRGGDWRRYRPKVVVVETMIAGSDQPTWPQWEPFLLGQDYRLALDDTLNRFYVAHEYPEIFSRFPPEPAPWNSVRHLQQFGRAPENADHPDHALAQVLARGFWATLPLLDHDLVMAILDRARCAAGSDEPEALPKNEKLLLALGRIACGYDGGQIVDK